jgi:hypothetical protein
VKSAATVVAVLAAALVAAWVQAQAQEQAEEFPVLQWHLLQELTQVVALVRLLVAALVPDAVLE